ncbi:GGDEF domain-containing protein [Ochrobactrum sp. WV_118_8]
MNGADFILLINMTVSGLFAFAFLGIAVYARDNAAAPVFSFGFIFAMLYFLTELAMPSIPNPRLGYMLAFSTYYLTLSCLVVGLARMYARPVPWIALGLLTIASLAAVYSIYDIARSQMIGMLLYQAPYFLVLLLAVWLILRVERNGIDTLMAILFGISAVHFLFKPVIAVLSGGAGAEPADYIDTTYAMFSQSIGAALSVAGGLLLLLSLMRELIANMLIRSETDQLSTLLNRRGFEFRAEAAIEKSKRMRQALSLVLCDIDHFKAINDTHGHALGDRVIAAFSAELRKAANAKGGITARIGGEEFAIILPGNTIQSAWRFADKTRLVCRDIHIPGRNGGIEFTVSFGIAEMEFDDVFSDLYKRADGALYEAKKGGRNCVRSALPILVDENVVEFRSKAGR